VPQASLKWGAADRDGYWVDCHPDLLQGLRAVNTNLAQQLPSFTWAALHLHVNYQSQIHTDSNAQGNSAMCTLGMFQGGRLWVQHQKPLLLTDAAASCPSPPDPSHTGALLDCNQKWRLFPSGTAHATEPFLGNRITILAYTPSPWPGPAIYHQCSQVIHRLRAEGFRPPATPGQP